MIKIMCQMNMSINYLLQTLYQILSTIYITHALVITIYQMGMMMVIS